MRFSPLYFLDELLDLAYDLGKRLLRAFPSNPNTTNPIPYAWVNLRTGVVKGLYSLYLYFPPYSQSTIYYHFFFICVVPTFFVYFCVKCVCALAVLTTGETQDTCTAGVGTLLLEFGILSHYTGMHVCMYVCIRVHTFIHLQIYL